jgi:hypothetical protein
MVITPDSTVSDQKSLNNCLFYEVLFFGIRVANIHTNNLKVSMMRFHHAQGTGRIPSEE